MSILNQTVNLKSEGRIFTPAGSWKMCFMPSSSKTVWLGLPSNSRVNNMESRGFQGNKMDLVEDGGRDWVPEERWVHGGTKRILERPIGDGKKTGIKGKRHLTLYKEYLGWATVLWGHLEKWNSRYRKSMKMKSWGCYCVQWEQILPGRRLDRVQILVQESPWIHLLTMMLMVKSERPQHSVVPLLGWEEKDASRVVVAYRKMLDSIQK